MKPLSTLVLLADESHARVLENHGVGKGLFQVSVIAASDIPDIPADYSDLPGRSHGSASGAGHVMDRTTSEKRQRRESFARHVLEAVEKQFAKGKFDRFVLAAPPSMLGAMRDLIDGPLANALAFDLDKDLVNTPLKDLPSHFEDQIVF